MKTLIIYVLIIIVIIGLCTAIWKISHNTFYSLVREVFYSSLFLIALYFSWKAYWKYYDPAETKMIREYIKDIHAPKEKNISYRTNQP